MLKCFHSFMTSAAPPLKKLLVNTIHFTPTVQTRGQGLHDGAFVLQYSLCETAAGGWWVVPRCGASYNMWNYIGALNISPAFEVTQAVCSCTNGYAMRLCAVVNGFLLTSHRNRLCSHLWASLQLLTRWGDDQSMLKTVRWRVSIQDVIVCSWLYLQCVVRSCVVDLGKSPIYFFASSP